jgi:hypothetical protein
VNAHSAANTPTRRLWVDLLMGGVFVLLVAFALWLVWITYFRATFQTGLVTAPKQGSMEEIMQPARPLEEHFHNLGDAVDVAVASPSLCYTCHGSYPHSKHEEIRAFLNAHAFFMACETCHVHRAEKGALQHQWLDNETGAEMTELQGEDGNYGGKIVPLREQEGVKVRLDDTGDREFAEQYLELHDYFNADQQAAAKLKLHKDLSKQIVTCIECHRREDPYLTFTDLGYSSYRASQLTGGEVVGMIRKYQAFHIPKLLRHQAVSGLDREAR